MFAMLTECSNGIVISVKEVERETESITRRRGDN